MGVVDDLEPVQVEDRDGDGLAGARAAGDGGVQGGAQLTAVGQAGQLVGPDGDGQDVGGVVGFAQHLLAAGQHVQVDDDDDVHPVAADVGDRIRHPDGTGLKHQADRRQHDAGAERHCRQDRGAHLVEQDERQQVQHDEAEEHRQDRVSCLWQVRGGEQGDAHPDDQAGGDRRPGGRGEAGVEGRVGEELRHAQPQHRVERQVADDHHHVGDADTCGGVAGQQREQVHGGRDHEGHPAGLHHGWDQQHLGGADIGPAAAAQHGGDHDRTTTAGATPRGWGATSTRSRPFAFAEYNA